MEESNERDRDILEERKEWLLVAEFHGYDVANRFLGVGKLVEAMASTEKRKRFEVALSGANKILRGPFCRAPQLQDVPGVQFDRSCKPPLMCNTKALGLPPLPVRDIGKTLSVCAAKSRAIYCPFLHGALPRP